VDLEGVFEEIGFRILRLSKRLRLRRLIFIGSTRGFMEYFKGFENSKAVRGIFGEDTENALGNLKVEFMGFGYMGVDNDTGHLLVNARYLKDGDRVDIYLDIIHELCHVKQWLEGKELFDSNYSYVDRPTEVEAYRYTVKEAKRLGLSNERILEYLRTEWISNTELQRLAKTVGIPCQ
jgi:hypothetical protein